MANPCSNYIEVAGNNTEITALYDKLTKGVSVYTLVYQENDPDYLHLGDYEKALAHFANEAAQLTDQKQKFTAIQSKDKENRAIIMERNFKSPYTVLPFDVDGPSEIEGIELYDYNVMRDSDDMLTIHIMSKNAPVIAYAQALAKAYPSLNMTHFYEECSNYIYGMALYRSGEQVECKELLQQHETVDEKIVRKWLSDNKFKEYHGSCPSCDCLLEEFDIDEERCPHCENDL